MPDRVLNEDQRDALQEIANLAIGQAATRLARLLDRFVELSVPRMRTVSARETAQVFRDMTGIHDGASIVRQGFRSDIKGEALVICPGGSIEELCHVVKEAHSGEEEEPVTKEELVFDIANILTGACVSSILDQLGHTPVYSAPSLVGAAVSLDDVFRPSVQSWEIALLLEVNLALEGHSFRVHLVTLLTESSVSHMCTALDAMLAAL
ncbi:chemotaxis protein CheC [Cupriavidus numazuensis]|uniref:CheC-like protein domain-containing protein n=1 Tax=Cupriavidus numazuensis TaxID=221992 RepID=A0ABN7Q292_9BURK|nr:chemotaxis protein CheC [Cupriavidus numazuensis]CAG2144668.1 hypothetical protein LMG26411_02603 [Cupriavidus numazuensis]